MKFTYGALFFLSGIIHLHSQKIAGKIEYDNARPAAFSTISFSNTSESITVISDVNGNFNVELKKELQYHLKCLDTLSLIDTIYTVKSEVDTLHIILSGTDKSDTLFLCADKEKALYDIRHSIYLYLPGGIAGTPTNDNDRVFEKKYRIYYTSIGCSRFPCDNHTEYNQTIFEYLDKKFGKNWRAQAHSGTIGLKDFLNSEK